MGGGNGSGGIVSAESAGLFCPGSLGSVGSVGSVGSAGRLARVTEEEGASENMS